MRQLKLDKEGQVIIDKDFIIIDGGEELLQSIERIITTQIGEWFLGPLGVEYDRIQGKNIDYAEIEYELTRAILTDERVKSIDRILIYETNEPRMIDVDITIVDVEGNYYTINNILSNGGAVIG